ncbi:MULTISPECIES: ECs1072 family phage-associated protein [Rahnella]|uniref:Uncharacterized protein n=1 Tax=Rahnella ecdela TaxID=2816250 RepID=A0ABS6LCT7_9GAMM|nr:MULTISPECIES: hypothetical protein [Rahnella]MBU9844751.1 hypothetical protein [Rahnella ecdela]
MGISMTDMATLFEQVHKNVKHSVGISEKVNSDQDVKACISHRTLMIFKLDLILFAYKQKMDEHRFILYGRNALASYLFTHYKVPFTEAKSLSLHDALTLILPDINGEEISQKLMTALLNIDGVTFHFHETQKHCVNKIMFDDSEWDPELCDALFLK